MNKLNYLKLFGLLSVILFTLPSCSDDEKGLDLTKDNISGKWQYVYGEYYDKYEDGTDWDSDNFEDQESYLTLDKDGTFIEENDYGDGKNYSRNGTWSLTGNKLTLTYFSSGGITGISSSFTVLDLKENTLIIEYSYKDEDYERSEKYTLERR